MFTEEAAKEVKPSEINNVLSENPPCTIDGISWWLHFCLDKKLSIEKRKEIAFNLGKNVYVNIDMVTKELNEYDQEWRILFDQLKDHFWSGVSQNAQITEAMFEAIYQNNGIKHLIDKENLPEELVKSIVDVHSYDLFHFYTNSISNKIKSALINSDNKTIREKAQLLIKTSNFNPFFDKNKETKNAAGYNHQTQQKGVVDNMEKSKLDKIKDTVINEIPEVTVRVSARQFVKLACAPIQGVCIRYDAHKANMFMHTQYGKSLVSLISSESLRFVKLSNPKYENIKNAVAKELRIQAFTGVGNEILDTLRPIVYDALKSVLSNNSINNTNTNSNTNLLADGAYVSTVNVNTTAKNKVEV